MNIEHAKPSLQAHEPPPWSLPISSVLSAGVTKDLHVLLAQIPSRWNAGVGGAHEFLGMGAVLHLPPAHTAEAAVPGSAAAQRTQRRAIFDRLLHHDLIETALLHGQDRFAELLAAGDKILRTGAQFDPRGTDLSVGVPLADGRFASIRPEVLEPLAYSSRYLLLRTQHWMGFMPFDGLRMPTAPASTGEIERAIPDGLRRERARIFEIAVAAAAQPGQVRSLLMSLAPSRPLTPYAEAVNAEFEMGYKPLEWSAWRQRKALEPGGEDHPATARAGVNDLTLADQVFVHRLARVRLDTLRRSGEEGLAAIRAFGAAIAGEAPRALERGELVGERPLAGLSTSRGTAPFSQPMLERLARADHDAWLETLRFVNDLGIPALVQPTGSERGDGADVPYHHVTSSVRNLVRLNVLSRAAILGREENASKLRYLENNLLVS